MTTQQYSLCVLIWFFFVTPVMSEGANKESEKTIPLPIHELSEVVADWYTRSGFSIHQMALNMGKVQLTMSRGKDRRQIMLTPWSALATKVSITLAAIDTKGNTFDQQLWWYLSDYINTPTTELPTHSQAIPPIVLSETKSVVCIQAGSGKDVNQFSGVIVDTSGLVLCTAHGLPLDRKIMVTLYDGREFKGTVIQKDVHKDLALLRIPLKRGAAISLVNGRNMLELGETVYSMGCSANHPGAIYIGKIHGPPRRMDELPLWQVQMEIHHGNSGSPVFDVAGNFVAMVKGRFRGTSSVGFLIPLETIIHFLKENIPS